jgi:hypothetical protein
LREELGQERELTRREKARADRAEGEAAELRAKLRDVEDRAREVEGELDQETQGRKRAEAEVRRLRKKRPVYPDGRDEFFAALGMAGKARGEFEALPYALKVRRLVDLQLSASQDLGSGMSEMEEKLFAADRLKEIFEPK